MTGASWEMDRCEMLVVYWVLGFNFWVVFGMGLVCETPFCVDGLDGAAVVVVRERGDGREGGVCVKGSWGVGGLEGWRAGLVLQYGGD
ncbi:hypothetical protein K458DRAFT_167498 [Lentithecium fluviatile CBS 122367]|uniref:Transmembrane protein n=1 Tax=Lentithecium fluviatile CBS 122367 TaxID=1168545 RepID=A0A6G1JAS3_9PLEO|nr:hypothetical protein K458DRAFT_167498 [Lentithecium fluviatile CBS 122367]